MGYKEAVLLSIVTESANTMEKADPVYPKLQLKRLKQPQKETTTEVKGQHKYNHNALAFIMRISTHSIQTP